MQIRLLRHATCVLRSELRVLTDPMLSRAEAMDPVQNAANTRRIPLVELPLDAAGLDALIRRLDAVLVTHLHRDHFDARAGEMLPRTLPVLCPPPDAGHFGTLGFEAVVPVETETEWRGIHFTRTGGRHGTGDVGRKMGAVSGFVLRGPAEPSLYLAGDTIWCGEVNVASSASAGCDRREQRRGSIPPGGPITMTAEDVVRVCRRPRTPRWSPCTWGR